MRQILLASLLMVVGPITYAQGDAAAGKTKATPCAACHGENGNKPIDANTPKIGGQHADYLVKVLQDYKSGARANAIMGAQAGTLSDQDIEDLAAYFAEQDGDLDQIPH